MSRFVFSGESSDYQQRREELLAAEIALKEQVERVAALRRSLPLGMSVPDYVFREGSMDLTHNDPGDFRDPCVMCSMWADGYSAVTPHVLQRTSFVLVAKADINKLRSWAKHRGWNRIRLLSSHDNTFNSDFGMEETDGSQNPGISVFTRTPDGAVYHRYTVGAQFDEHNNRGIDTYSPVWNLFDLLPQGRGDWYPNHDYMS
jgi:predicted dithiol-disulfide oxidoreductase (DUF899 family)